jgi:hypothetical protein
MRKHARYREALEYYANHGDSLAHWTEDWGRVAREALSRPENKRNPQVRVPGPTTYTEACACSGWETGFHLLDCGVYHRPEGERG